MTDRTAAHLTGQSGRGETRLLTRIVGYAAVLGSALLLAGSDARICTAALAISLAAWRFIHWPSFAKWVLNPIRSRVWLSRLRRDWSAIAHHCGLGTPTIPRLKRSRHDWPRLQLIARPSVGQTYGDFEKAAEALRLSVGASQIRVEPHGVRDVSLRFTIGYALAHPIEAKVPNQVEQLSEALMGRRSDGSRWTLPVGPHTLVAGSSGSGKGSLFWSFAFALAPAVHDGRVQLHGIDLKGGMEILMGGGLFTTRATSALEAVVSLERLVELMRRRTIEYAGRIRSHQPTPEQPLHVVMIDELAALTAYCPERELQRRSENAINLICSQGRAPGFMVFACLQDPRKEVIPSRGLFTQMVGLRLKDMSETSMVLGEVAVLSGAHCHRITRGTPGVGYVVPEDGGHPIRVRAGYASDEAIRDVSRRYAAPFQVALDTHELENDLAARALPRPRSPRSER